jgi:hypothetical protein
VVVQNSESVKSGLNLLANGATKQTKLGVIAEKSALFVTVEVAGAQLVVTGGIQLSLRSPLKKILHG